MPIDLGRRLIASGAAPRDKVQAALFLSVVRGIPFTRALVDRGAISEADLEQELTRYAGLGLRHVVGAPDLVAKIPLPVCRRLCALPTRIDPFTGTVDVAAADPLDSHIATEFTFHLGAPVRVLRAPMAAVEEAIRRMELSAAQQGAPKKPRGRRITPPFPHGAPQSSIPPPPTSSAPIPLVRRVTEQIEAEIASRGAPATRRGTPKTMESAVEPEVPTARPMRVPSPARGVALPEPAAEEPPRVSFPSSPPPPNSGPPSTPPLAVAPPELSAWRGVTQPRPALELSAFSREPPSGSGTSPRIVDEPTPTLGSRADMWTTHEFSIDDGGSARTSRAFPSSPPPESTAGPNSFAPAPSARMGMIPSPVITEMVEEEEDEDEEQAQERKTIAGPPPLPFPDPSAILSALRRAASRDEIVKLSLGGMSLFARRVALFAVKRDGYQGWACNEEFGDPDALRALLIPPDQPSILATATAASMYLGPIPRTAAHAGLLAVMERASNDVAAVAVRVAGRPAAVLLADELGDTMQGTRRMDELSRAVGEALSRLLAARG